MRKGTISIALVLIALLSRPQTILAQTAAGPIKGSWDSLKSIPPGDELVVTLRNGQTITSAPDPSGFGFLILGTIGVGAGALTGYIIGSRKQRVLIYETN